MSEKKKLGQTRRGFIKQIGAAAVGLPLVGVPWHAVKASDGRETPCWLRPITLRVNNTEHHLEVEPRRTLAEVLREDLGLTGTKIACDRAFCGACTVLMDGRTAFACHTLAVQADGRSVETTESLAEEG